MTSQGTHERQQSSNPRRRVNRACDKCHSLKTKCDGKMPVCKRCSTYGHDCSYFDERRSTRRATAARVIELESVVGEYDSLLHSLLPKLSDHDRKYALNKVHSLRNKSKTPSGVVRGDVRSLTDSIPPNGGLSYRPNNSAGNSASSATASEGFLGVGSDITFLRNTLQELQVQQPTGVDDNEPLRSYNLDEADSYNRSPLLPPYILPSRTVAETMANVYFSTVHVAYPFLSREMFETLFPQLWAESASHNLSDSWKATFYMVFAWGAAYAAMSEEPEAANDDHVKYYNQARLYLGDVIDIFPPQIDLIACLLLVSLYLLMTHKPYRCANMLGITIRMAQGIGLHAAYEKGDLSEHEKERRRRIWYCLFILDRLVALQLGGAVIMRDADFSVELPSTVLANDDFEVSYLCNMVGLSKVIGHVIDHLYRPAQAIIQLDQLLETIRSLDAELLGWRDELPFHLRFDHSHSFEKNPLFKRQRNFLGIKFHHLRTLIHRPCLCLEILHSKELDDATRNRGGVWDHAASRLAEATCISEARQTIQMLDGLMDKRGLLWEFPWWQMISCLMCAQSVIMITRIVYPQHVESAGLQADTETCYKVLEALSTKSAAAERCLKIIDQMRDTQFRQRELNTSSGTHLGSTPAGLLQPFVDGIGSFQDAQADVVESMYNGWFHDAEELYETQDLFLQMRT